jgi:hypothetical protein
MYSSLAVSVKLLRRPSFATEITNSFHAQMNDANMLIEMVPPISLVGTVETLNRLVLGLNYAS